MTPITNQASQFIRPDLKHSVIPDCFKKVRGFTLIELMIVVLIIGIIAAFAYPSYLDQIRKSRRADGLALLGDAASRMEQFYLNRKSYSIAAITDLGYVDNGADDALSQEGYYLLSLSSPIPTDACVAANNCFTFTLQVTPTTKGGQNDDGVCSAITINNNGNKLPKACW